MIGGIVVPGDGIGKQYGFPTANIDLSRDSISLSSGVYAVRAVLDRRKYKGAMALQSYPWKAEVHIFDYDGEDFYGAYLEVDPIQKVGEMQKFSVEADLKEKIKSDIKLVKEFFGGM